MTPESLAQGRQESAEVEGKTDGTQSSSKRARKKRKKRKRAQRRKAKRRAARAKRRAAQRRRAKKKRAAKRRRARKRRRQRARRAKAPSTDSLLLREEDAERSRKGSCLRKLDRKGVAYERVRAASAPEVQDPVILVGALEGVQFVFRGNNPAREVMACELLLVLRRWASILRSEGVVELVHMSSYRKVLA